jgi:hypothetical protein
MALHPKVTGSALAGALVGIIITEAQRRGITIDASEGADLVVIVSLIVGYFVPNGDHADTQPEAAPVPPVAAPPPARPVAPPPPPAPVVIPAPPVPPPQAVVIPPQVNP